MTFNLDGVQHEKARRVVDLAFVNRMKELDDCYYNHWKLGQPKDFYGVAYPGTPEKAHVLFNRLAGVLNDAYSVALIKANRNLAEPYPDEDINPVRDSTRDRVFKKALDAMNKEFLRRVKENPPATFGEMVSLWNSIPLEAGEHASAPMPLKTRGERAVERIRAFEADTGLKVRDLVGSLPER